MAHFSRAFELPDMLSFFFFNDTATTEIYPLSLHDALPISVRATSNGSAPTTPRTSQPTLPQARVPNRRRPSIATACTCSAWLGCSTASTSRAARSEEHTSELQSHSDLVCRLLLEKKKTSRC